MGTTVDEYMRLQRLLDRLYALYHNREPGPFHERLATYMVHVRRASASYADTINDHVAMLNELYAFEENNPELMAYVAMQPYSRAKEQVWYEAGQHAKAEAQGGL